MSFFTMMTLLALGTAVLCFVGVTLYFCHLCCRVASKAVDTGLTCLNDYRARAEQKAERTRDPKVSLVRGSESPLPPTETLLRPAQSAEATPAEQLLRAASNSDAA